MVVAHHLKIIVRRVIERVPEHVARRLVERASQFNLLRFILLVRNRHVRLLGVGSVTRDLLFHASCLLCIRYKEIALIRIYQMPWLSFSHYRLVV